VTEPPSGSTAPSVPEAPSRPPAPAPSTQSPTRRALRPRRGPHARVSATPDLHRASRSTRRRCRIERPDSNGQDAPVARHVAPAERHRAWPHAPPATHSEEGRSPQATPRWWPPPSLRTPSAPRPTANPGARAADGGAADVTARARASGATWSASTSSPTPPDRHARGPLARRALRLEVADDTNQIDGNVYRDGSKTSCRHGGGVRRHRIPKNAVLYRGDVHYDRDDVEGGGDGPARASSRCFGRARSSCARSRRTDRRQRRPPHQEVSLPGRFACSCQLLGVRISKRLSDNERRRLRRIVDEVRPEGHG